MTTDPHDLDELVNATHYDPALEQAAVGSMMIDQVALNDVRRILTADDLASPANVKVFTACVDLAETGRPVDIHTVRAHLDARGQLDSVGGAVYLFTLIQAPAIGRSGGYYARQVVDLATRRRIAELGTALRSGARSGVEPAAVIERAQSVLAKLSTRGGDELALWRDIAPGAMDRIEEAGQSRGKVSGISTGIPDLDRMINGLQDGQLVIVAGATGMGKSVALAGMARDAAMRNKLPTAVFSLEMNRHVLFNRFTAAACQINLDKVISGDLDDTDWTKIARWCGDTADAPLLIGDRPDIRQAHISATIAKARERHGLRLAIVDYIQRIPVGRAESRQIAIGELARANKSLAENTGIPIVMGAQINRNSRDRADKTPELDDLRESAVIGHEADVVIIIHRPEYYDRESPRRGEADFIVAKNRNGPTGVVTVASQLHYSRFVPMAMP